MAHQMVLALPGVAACRFVWRGVLVAPTCLETGGVLIQGGHQALHQEFFNALFSSSFLSHSTLQDSSRAAETESVILLSVCGHFWLKIRDKSRDLFSAASTDEVHSAQGEAAGPRESYSIEVTLSIEETLHNISVGLARNTIRKEEVQSVWCPTHC